MGARLWHFVLCIPVTPSPALGFVPHQARVRQRPAPPPLCTRLERESVDALESLKGRHAKESETFNLERTELKAQIAELMQLLANERRDKAGAEDEAARLRQELERQGRSSESFKVRARLLLPTLSPACLPARPPAYLHACMPESLPARLPARLLACLPAWQQQAMSAALFQLAAWVLAAWVAALSGREKALATGLIFALLCCSVVYGSTSVCAVL